MKFLKGKFIGNYSGRQVDPLRMRSVLDLHFLHVEAGGNVKDVQWLDHIPYNEMSKDTIKVDSIENTDLYFDHNLYPDQRPFRDHLKNCLILNPKVHTVSRNGDYTYGKIEGEIFAALGTPIEAKQQTMQPLESKTNNITSIIPLPITSFAARTDTLSSKTISWGGFWRFLVWVLLGLWMIWWLLTHRGCESIPSRSSNSFKRTEDSIPVMNNNDTLSFASNKVSFSVFDWSVEDMDTINVFLNNELIKENIELNKSILSWIQYDLKKGENILTIESVNNGSIGPASPTIEINDGNRVQVFQVRVYKGRPQNFYLVTR